MAFPRYQQKPVQIKGGASTAYQAQALQQESFVQKIEQFKGMAIDQYKDATVQEAKQDAEKAFTEFGINAEINNELTVYGEQYTRTLESMHVKQLAIDTSNNMEKVYSDNKDNPALFEVKSNAHYKKTLELIPPHLKADYTIDFEANKAKFSGLVKQNRIKLDKEKNFALSNTLYTKSFDGATQASRTGDATIAAYEMGKAIKILDEDLSTQTISADEHRTRVDNLKFGVSKANFKGVNDKNIKKGDLSKAQEFVNEFRKTQIEGFNDEQRESLADEMQRDINTEIRLKNNESKVKLKYDNQEVKDLVFLLDNGEILNNKRIEKGLTSNASPEHKEKLILAKRDNKELANFNILSLEEMGADIETAKGLKNKSADELRLEQKKVKYYERAKKEIDKNPLNYSYGKAFKTEIKELDMQDESFMSDTKERINQVQLASEYTKKQVGFFTTGEASSIKTRIPVMKTSEKLDLIGKINQLPKVMARNTFRQFGGELQFAGTLMQSGNKDGARISLLGKGAKVDIDTDQVKTVKEEIARIYGRNFNQEYHNMQVNGVVNYIKGMALGDEGVTADEAITNTIGEQTSYNNKSLLLPQGVEKAQFDMFLDTIVIEDNPLLQEGLRDMQDSFFDGSHQLHTVGQGRYIVKFIDDDGNLKTEMDAETGKPYILDYAEYNK